jgi:hypothetical protein
LNKFKLSPKATNQTQDNIQQYDSMKIKCKRLNKCKELKKIKAINKLKMMIMITKLN